MGRCLDCGKELKWIIRNGVKVFKHCYCDESPGEEEKDEAKDSKKTFRWSVREMSSEEVETDD